MTLLKTVVLLDVVQVIPSNDDSPQHLHLGDDAGQDTASDGNITGEGALLVDIARVNLRK